MKICSMAYIIYQRRFKILPSKKYTLKILPKTYNILPKWRNFVKSVSHWREAKTNKKVRNVLDEREEKVQIAKDKSRNR